MSKVEKSLTPDKYINNIVKILCIECSNQTNQKVLKSIDVDKKTTYYNYPHGLPMPEESFVYQENESWQITQCNGCELLSFRKLSSNSEDFDHDGSTLVIEEIYPIRSLKRKQLDFEDVFVPYKVKKIYEETYLAISNQQHILAGIGVRALVEAVCKERGTTNYNLADKIAELHTLGVLTENHKEFLHKLRVMGNYSAHETKPQIINDLEIALDIIEHLLKDIYILPHQTEKLPNN